MFMEKMHHASNSGIAKAIMALIAVSFMVTGMYGYLGSRGNSYALKVNGDEISQQQFQQRYNEEYQRASQALGAKFSAIANTPEFTNGIRAQVMNQLIEQRLLNQYISDLKVTVSDQRIQQEIVNTPMFQVDGKFNNDAYRQVLRQNNMSPDMYAEYMREMLRLGQLQEGLADTNLLMPASQQEFANLFFQQRKVRLAKLSVADELAQQQVSEEEIKAYYEANPNAFMVPELVKVQYLDLTKAATEQNVMVKDADVEQYYQHNLDKFMSKAKQHLAHIQFAKESEALDAYQALQDGADFAELAKTKSLDKLSGAKGGDLGWLNNGDLPKDFEDAAILVEVGKFSTPIKVDGNYHIVWVKDRKEAKPLPLEQVKARITAQLHQDLLISQFYAVEKKVAEKAFEDQSSLKAAAEVAGLEVQETGYFSRDDVPKALDFPTVVHAMFEGDISQGNVNSEPMNVEDQHSLVVRVLEHKAQGKKSLEESKDEIATMLKRQKAEAALLAKAKEAIAPLAESAAKSAVEKLPNNWQFGEQETWVYAQNQDPMLNNQIFAMKPQANGKAYGVAQSNAGDVVIIALDAIENASLEEAVRHQFDNQVARAKALDVQINLIKSLRNRAKIEINEDFMKQDLE